MARVPPSVRAAGLQAQLCTTDLPGDAWVCAASGSGGTQAGLILGPLLHGRALRVQCFSVWQKTDYLTPVVRSLAAQAAKLLDLTLPADLPVYLDDSQLPPGYARANEACLAAMELLGRLEGIVLDQVYTAKAMAGVLDYIRR